MMRAMRWAAGLFVLGIGLTAASARADERAGALFDQGLADMLAGNYDVACPALAESYRLEPLPGALFTLAECESKWGRVASARAHYLEYLARIDKMSAENRDAQGDRPGVAREQVDALSAEVPELTIELAADTPDDAVLTRDGVRVPPKMVGVAIPVDPGRHELRLEVPGRAPQSKVVELGRGERRRVTLGGRGATKKSPQGKPAPGPAPAPTSGLAIAAYVVGGVGLASAIAGTIAGGVALGKKSDIDAECVDHECSEEGLEAVGAAQTAGTISTITLILGAVGLAAGTTMWLLAGGTGDDEPPLVLVPTRNGLALRW
jgi:hypothetical protein